jgi:hypothetical protein
MCFCDMCFCDAQVEMDEILCEVETDKVTVEIRAPDAGVCVCVCVVCVCVCVLAPYIHLSLSLSI